MPGERLIVLGSSSSSAGMSGGYPAVGRSNVPGVAPRKTSSASAVAAAEEQLYGLPLAEFTAARNVLAREAAERDAAEAIRSLRKPSVPAWALNQLARSDADAVRALVRAGRDLRSAQEDLLAGGDRDAFREASKLEQQLVSELAGRAVEIARQAGAAASEALKQRVADTLRAAVLDDEVAEALVAGRLVREQAAAGMAGDLTASAAAPRKARKKAARAEPSAAEQELRRSSQLLREAEKAEESARKRRESAGRQAERLRERAEEANARLRAAEADLDAAEESLTSAASDRERLAHELDQLRRRAGS